MIPPSDASLSFLLILLLSSSLLFAPSNCRYHNRRHPEPGDFSHADSKGKIFGIDGGSGTGTSTGAGAGAGASHRHKSRSAAAFGSPKPFGSEKPSRVQEFNRTGVLHPEYQIPATLKPGNVSRFYYLSPREGPPLTLLVSPCSGPISWTVSYVEPPEDDENAEAKTKWPVKSLKPGSPLFSYEGSEDENFTIAHTRAGLYWFEMRSVAENENEDDEAVDNHDDDDDDNDNEEKRPGPGKKQHPVDPKTVLLYATSRNLEYLSRSYESATGRKRKSRLRFQQKRSRRRLTVSWSRSHVDPHLSNYCLVVTSNSQAHPSTLCAAKKLLRVHVTSSSPSSSSPSMSSSSLPSSSLTSSSSSSSPSLTSSLPSSSSVSSSTSSSTSSPSSSPSSSAYGAAARSGWHIREHQHRGIPEGVHCIQQTRLTLYRMKYNTTYNFTLYVINGQSNVSHRLATESLRFRKTPPQALQNGRYAIVNLRKNDGYVNFRYRPRRNATTVFHILPCGGGIVSAKLRGPGILRDKEVVGYASLKETSLIADRRYTLRISATPQELLRVSIVKVLATQETSLTYPELPLRSPPREYRSLRKCHEVTIGVEPAGAAKYCVLVRELRSPRDIATVASIPDQCGLHRRRRSEYTYELCEEKTSPPPPMDKALPFTVKRLQPGRSYLVQITAQLKGQFLSYPQLGVRTRRSCGL